MEAITREERRAMEKAVNMMFEDMATWRLVQIYRDKQEDIAALLRQGCCGSAERIRADMEEVKTILQKRGAGAQINV